MIVLIFNVSCTSDGIKALNTELILSRLSFSLVQTGFALVLVLVLWHFYRIYQRHYLKSWALAFLSFACYVLCQTTYHMLASPSVPMVAMLAFLEFSYIFSCYCFAIWVLVGVREAVTSERIPARVVNQLLLLVAALALLSVLLFAFDAGLKQWKFYLQVNLRLLFIGTALSVAGAWLFTLQNNTFVTRLVACSVLLWGGQLIVVALLSVWLGQSVWLDRVLWVSKYLELFCQTILGLGFIIWLQEDERTANQQLTAKTRYLDSHDHLTGALNRDALLEQLTQLLRQQQPFILIMLGLDRFKTVNESVGLKQGDRILREVNRRFEASILKPKLIARTGGDIFALVLVDVASEKQRQFSLQHLEQQVEKPFNFEGAQLKLTASMGIAIFPEHANNAETLLQKANIAFHHAKRQQLRWVHYQNGMEEESARLMLLEKELLRAIEQDELVFYFQPQWNLREQRIDAFEALVRWQHPVRGLLMPGQFLPAVEQLGLSQKLDLVLLEKAVVTLGRWRTQRIMLPIAVNMSPIHFEQEGLRQKIQQLLQQYQVPPTMLELEITENTAMGDMEKGRNFVTELQQMGIRVSIDDFGTGYSSLGYLRKMPIDKIKIDRSFIIDMAGSDSDMMIVKTMITLAHGLGKRILAEGVEDEHQFSLLRHMACDAVQGYLIAKPLPEAEALALLKTPPNVSPHRQP
jgi:diguanylate cyclase (GGDEF)-like protein